MLQDQGQEHSGRQDDEQGAGGGQEGGAERAFGASESGHDISERRQSARRNGQDNHPLSKNSHSTSDKKNRTSRVKMRAIDRSPQVGKGRDRGHFWVERTRSPGNTFQSLRKPFALVEKRAEGGETAAGPSSCGKRGRGQWTIDDGRWTIDNRKAKASAGFPVDGSGDRPAKSALPSYLKQERRPVTRRTGLASRPTESVLRPTESALPSYQKHAPVLSKACSGPIKSMLRSCKKRCPSYVLFEVIFLVKDVGFAVDMFGLVDDIA